MTSLLIRNPRVVWRAALGQVVVLLPGEREPNVLAPPGGAIWEQLRSPTTVAGLVMHLAKVFDAAESVVRDDVERFVAQLLEHGLAIRVPDPA